MPKDQDSVPGEQWYILCCRACSQFMESTQASAWWEMRDDTTEVKRPVRETDHIFTFLLQVWTPYHVAAPHLTLQKRVTVTLVPKRDKEGDGEETA